MILREIDVCQEAQEVRASTAECTNEKVDTREIPKIDVIIPPESDDAEMNVRISQSYQYRIIFVFLDTEPFGSRMDSRPIS